MSRRIEATNKKKENAVLSKETIMELLYKMYPLTCQYTLQTLLAETGDTTLQRLGSTESGCEYHTVNVSKEEALRKIVTRNTFIFKCKG